jgi:hypothetical protein
MRSSKAKSAVLAAIASGEQEVIRRAVGRMVHLGRNHASLRFVLVGMLINANGAMACSADMKMPTAMARGAAIPHGVFFTPPKGWVRLSVPGRVSTDEHRSRVFAKCHPGR